MPTDLTLMNIKKANECKTKAECDEAILAVRNTYNWKMWQLGIAKYVDKSYVRRVESLNRRKIYLKK